MWVRVIVFNATFNNYFSYIVQVSFISGGNGSILRKPPTNMWVRWDITVNNYIFMSHSRNKSNYETDIANFMFTVIFT